MRQPRPQLNQRCVLALTPGVGLAAIAPVLGLVFLPFATAFGTTNDIVAQTSVSVFSIAIASVIAGATSPAQITANVAAVEWTLTPQDLAAVEAVLDGA